MTTLRTSYVALVTRAHNHVDGLAVFNLVVIVAAVILALIAVLKLCGAPIAPRATWWGLLLAAGVLFIVWLIV